MMQRMANASPPPGCISDLQLDKMRAGELSEQAALQLDQHLATCTRCSQKQKQLAAEATRFLQQFPEPPRAAPGAQGGRGRWLAVASTGLAAAAALVLWLHEPGEPRTRSKGTSSLSFFVNHLGAVTPGQPGQRVYPGDQLRLTVSTSKPQHLAVLGRDDTGAAFVYHPASPFSAALSPGREVALPSSIELDDTPGTETIWAIFCDEAFAVDPLRAELATSGGLRQPPGCSIETLQVVKGGKR